MEWMQVGAACPLEFISFAYSLVWTCILRKWY